MKVAGGIPKVCGAGSKRTGKDLRPKHVESSLRSSNRENEDPSNRNVGKSCLQRLGAPGSKAVPTRKANACIGAKTRLSVRPPTVLASVPTQKKLTSAPPPHTSVARGVSIASSQGSKHVGESRVCESGPATLALGGQPCSGGALIAAPPVEPQNCSLHSNDSAAMSALLCRICDMPEGRRTRSALRQALIADCTADPRTGQPGTGTFADLLEWIQLADFPDIPPVVGAEHSRPNFMGPGEDGVIKRVLQVALVPERLEAAVCNQLFMCDPLRMATHVYFFAAELRLVRKLLHARCSATSSFPGLRHDPHHLRYTFSLLSMFWADTVEALRLGCTVTESRADACEGADRSAFCISAVRPKDSNSDPVFNRDMLVFLPVVGDCLGARDTEDTDQLLGPLLSRMCVIRELERATGLPSASASAIAERCRHYEGHTALTLPLLNMACDGFRACIAFHLPDTEGTDTTEEDVCYWVQARDDREYVLFMLLMSVGVSATDMEELLEGCREIDPCTGGELSLLKRDLSLSASLPRFSGLESERAVEERLVHVHRCLQGQKHVSLALEDVLCFMGYPVRLPLTEDLLYHRRGVLLTLE